MEQMFSAFPPDAAGNLDYKNLVHIITHGEEKDQEWKKILCDIAFCLFCLKSIKSKCFILEVALVFVMWTDFNSEAKWYAVLNNKVICEKISSICFHMTPALILC